MSDRQPSNSDRLTRLTARYPKQATFQMYRNMCLGASGVCLLVILTIAEANLTSVASAVALHGAAIGLPVWLCLGVVLEYYILIGPRSYPHYRSTMLQHFYGAGYLVGGTAIMAAVGGLLVHLGNLSVVTFAIAGVVSIFAAALFHRHFANWFFTTSEKDDGEDA